MSHDLIMDVSREIFKLSKDVLIFKINPSNINKLSSYSSTHSGQLQPLSEEDIIITNLTSEYLAFRIKTTKKENYAVNPTYCIISPKENKAINFIYYNNPGAKFDAKGHKFKFEGFIIQESRKNEDVKDLFYDYIKKGIKVSGNSLKLYVRFSEEGNEDNQNILKGSNILLGNSSGTVLSNYTEVENIKQNTLLSDIIKDNKNENEKENIKFTDIVEDNNNRGLMEKNKEKYENLKREYIQLKEQVDNLKRNEELLNKRIMNEKNKKSSSKGSIKFTYKVPEGKEEKLSRNKLIGFFVIALLVGFYLTK